MNYIVILINLSIIGLLFGASALGIGLHPTQTQYVIIIPAIITILVGLSIKNKRIYIACSIATILLSSYFIEDNGMKNLISGDIITILGVICGVSSFFIKKNTLPQGEYSNTVEIIEI